MNPFYPSHAFFPEPFNQQWFPGALSGGLGTATLPQSEQATGPYGPLWLQPQSFLVPQSELDADRQALDAFYEDACAGLLSHINKYLEENKVQHKELADCIPLIQRAVDLYEARNFAAAFMQLLQVYRFIVRLKQRIQGLPIP